MKYKIAIIRTSRDEAIVDVEANSIEEAKQKARMMVNEVTFSQKQKPGYEMEEVNGE